MAYFKERIMKIYIYALFKDGLHCLLKTYERVVTVFHNITDDGKTSKFGEHFVKYAAYVFVYA